MSFLSGHQRRQVGDGRRGVCSLWVRSLQERSPAWEHLSGYKYMCESEKDRSRPGSRLSQQRLRSRVRVEAPR